MIGVLVTPLVVGVGHDNVRPLLPDEADERPDCLLEWSRGEGARCTARWHIRVPVAEHPDSLIAQMRRRRGQFRAADLREACLYLRVIECRVLDSAGLTTSATDEHCAHT